MNEKIIAVVIVVVLAALLGFGCGSKLVGPSSQQVSEWVKVAQTILVGIEAAIPVLGQLAGVDKSKTDEIIAKLKSYQKVLADFIASHKDGQPVTVEDITMLIDIGKYLNIAQIQSNTLQAKQISRLKMENESLDERNKTLAQTLKMLKVK